MLSAFANNYIRTVTGLRVRDCTSGYRCWRREALARLPLERHLVGRLLVPRRSDVSRRGRGHANRGSADRVRRAPAGASKLSSSVLVESLITPWRLVARSWPESVRYRCSHPS